MPAHKEHRIGSAVKQRAMLRKLGASMRQARAAMGISQAQAAALVGCSHQTIGNIEGGVYWPSSPVMLSIREHLCISLDEICPLKAR